MSEEMKLLSDLKVRFGVKILEPYGFVIPIPNRSFEKTWVPQLEKIGCKLFSQNMNGEVFHFIKSPRNAEGNVENQTETQKTQKQQHRKKWSNQDLELLKQMNAQGFLTSEIADKLGRTKNAIRFKKRSLGLTDLVPYESTDSEPEEADPQPTLQNDLVIREYLQCAGELYPRFPHVCSLLLKEASNKILEREGEKQS